MSAMGSLYTRYVRYTGPSITLVPPPTRLPSLIRSASALGLTGRTFSRVLLICPVDSLGYLMYNGFTG